MEQIYEVSQINYYIKGLLERDGFLGQIAVRGELSNYKVYPSGHHYFTLKDPEGSLRCVMFAGSAKSLRFRPQVGMKVILVGSIRVFPRDGAYQLYCQHMTPDGVGDLHVAFEQLKEKLAGEGLFDDRYKKPLPRFPHRIAIVTSSAGAAIHDMLRVMAKRYPLATIYLLPVRVQGVEAPAEIAGAIAYANRWQLADVLIVGRGGGSMEDLWGFNDEKVARAIFNSEIPVVSAVGHEPDVTISDYVADLRAATPSNGGELVTPDQTELRLLLDDLSRRMASAMERKIKLARQRLLNLSQRPALQSPMYYIEGRRVSLDHQDKRLHLAMDRVLEQKSRKLAQLAVALDAISPLKVLGRGYSLVKQEGQLVKSIEDVTDGQSIDVELVDGTVTATVKGRTKRGTAIHGI